MKANMLEHLEETALRVPCSVAFYDDRESLTFAALREIARRIGSRLAEITPPRAPVALLLDARSIRNLPALYGVLYAGCAYAPLDIAMPAERLSLLLSLLRPAAVVADARGLQALAACGAPNCPVVSYADAAAYPIAETALSAVRRQASVYDPLSILYTSGSTGIPKGSVQTHFSYLHWTEATIKTYGLGEDTVFGNQSPFFYANSILDIFPPVALGAKVYLLPSGVLNFPKKLIACLNDQKITELCMTPSSFIGVANSGALTSRESSRAEMGHYERRSHALGAAEGLDGSDAGRRLVAFLRQHGDVFRGGGASGPGSSKGRPAARGPSFFPGAHSICG